MDARTTKSLRGYFEANRVLTALKDEINTSIVNTFIGVCIWGHESDNDEPLTIRQLSERIGLPYTTVSRHLRYLGDMERFGKDGMGLVQTDIYVMNRRQKVVSLTTKGRSLRDRVAFALGKVKGD